MKIAVLLGGTSAEREVSIASGLKIADALDKRGHDVIAIDTAGGLKQIDISEGHLVGVTPPNGNSLQELSDRYLSTRLDSKDFSDIDVTFIGLHGGSGEDGTIQELLDISGIIYTGSDARASAIAMNKAASKLLFQVKQILTPTWILIDHEQKLKKEIFLSEIENIFEFPLVIKPNAQGSTVGLSIVNSNEEIKPAIDFANKYDTKVLIEEYIPGREITCAIVGDYDLPVIEIIPEGGLYDYECKYTDGKSKYVCPAELPEEVAEKCKQISRLAFDTIGCRDYGRVDFRMDDEFNLYCLEVNTLPGMTPTSLVPKAMKAMGIEFDELVEIISKLALEHLSVRK